MFTHFSLILQSYSLVLQSLNNVLLAMVLWNRVAMAIFACPYSSNSHVPHAYPSLGFTVLSSLGQMMVVVLLLLLSGDIETNPGPVGKSFVNLTSWWTFHHTIFSICRTAAEC